MKNRLFICFTLLFIVFCPLATGNMPYAHADRGVNLVNPEQMHEVILAVLIPKIREAVDKYYSEYFVYPPVVDSFASGAEITDIKVSDGGSVFTITVEISPYQGAHNSIGRDRIVILADQSITEVIRFEHLESYELMPWLNSDDDLIKPYP